MAVRRRCLSMDVSSTKPSAPLAALRTCRFVAIRNLSTAGSQPFSRRWFLPRFPLRPCESADAKHRCAARIEKSHTQHRMCNPQCRISRKRMRRDALTRAFPRTALIHLFSRGMSIKNTCFP
jgi:hypothetical protein